MRIYLRAFFFVLCCALQVVGTQEMAPLQNGWHTWEPYNYAERGEDGIYRLTGLDAEIMKALAAEARLTMTYAPIEWDAHKNALKTGKMDMAAGITRSPSLDPFVHYSMPYREEKTAFFIPKKGLRTFEFHDVPSFIAGIQKSNFRLGVVKGFVYGDPALNEFINDPRNRDHIIYSTTDAESLKKLLHKQIDGFLAERLSGATVIWKAGQTSRIEEYALGKGVPIQIAFSKKSVPLAQVEKFNVAIQEIKANGKFDRLFSQYLHPLLLLQTLDSDWFFYIEIIGTIAFAISGLLLAFKDRATLFGAFIYALLPSAGGGIMRDVLVGRQPVGLMLTPVYMATVILTVLIGFWVLRWAARSPHFFEKKWKHMGSLLIISDALGLASFTVIGVVVAMLMRMEPLYMWGPFLAFLTGAGGGILRDITRKTGHVSSLHEDIYGEVAILWGLFLSLYLTWDAHNVDAFRIMLSVMLTMGGVFMTRMMIARYKIQNIFFR